MTNRLLRVLGAAFAIAVTFGGTVGPGILRSPGLIAEQLGNYWLILLMWALGGVYALFGTMSVAEMAATLPLAGGLYVYPRRAFGGAAGFAIGWSDWIATCATVAFIGITVGDFAAEFSPAFAGRQTLIGVLLILLVGLVQRLGIVVSSRVQECISVLQAVALLALIVACFALGGGAASGDAAGSVPQTPRSPFAWIAAMIVAFRFIVVDYDGWYTAIYFAEEEREPANLPRAMIQGVVGIIAFYLLLNAAFLHVLPAGKIAGLKLAASDVARLVFGERGGKLVTLVALVCTTAVVNAVVLTLTRTLYGLSRDGLFWRRAETVNAAGTPTVALFLSCSASVALVATGTFEKLVAIASFLFVVNYSSAVLSLLMLRKREPELPRPWRVPWYPYVPLAVLSTGVGFLIADLVTDPGNSLPALGLLACSYPVYLLTRSRPGRSV